MKHLDGGTKLQNILNNYGFKDIFGTLDLPFFLVEFDKGDVVNDLMNPSENLIFLLNGSASIYHVRRDGTLIALYSSRTTMSCLGDLEFAKPDSTQFQVEITSETAAVVLPLASCRSKLESDTTFLRWLLRSLADKLDASGIGNIESTSLESAVLYYMRRHEGLLRKPGQAAALLHCSRRQLQRILASFQKKGIVVRTARGCYQLVSFDARRKTEKALQR